jgi:hypothetical protein
MDRNDRAFIVFASLLCGWFAVAAATVHTTLRAVPHRSFDWCVDSECFAVVEDDIVTIGLLFVGMIASLVALSRLTARLPAALATPTRTAATVLACVWLYAVTYCFIAAGIRAGYTIEWPADAGAVDGFRRVGRTHMVIGLVLLAAAAPGAVVAGVRFHRPRRR